MRNYFIVDLGNFKDYKIPYDAHATLDKAKKEFKSLEEKDGIGLWRIYKVTIEEVKDTNDQINPRPTTSSEI